MNNGPSFNTQLSEETTHHCNGYMVPSPPSNPWEEGRYTMMTCPLQTDQYFKQ